MPYSQFSFKEVKQTFELTEVNTDLFIEVVDIKISDWLQTTLAITKQIPLKSEKARSEGIVAPFLFELKQRNSNKIALFSGEDLEVDKQRNLNGECDFILTRNPQSTTIDTPIFCLVEAKRNIIDRSLGQCIAQMVGAREFNYMEETTITTIFGVVTTGEIWQFLKLEKDIINTDNIKYYIDNPNKLLGALQTIVDFY
ncbi:hypothetical protein QUF50_02210 [Thiotrichales bacterium HSG1]|nr:hypothetical protein [Thiotrichales bacterium HSG1]